MKLIIDIPEEQIPTKQEIIYIPIHFIDKQVVEAGGLGFMQIPDNATNGEVIREEQLDWLYRLRSEIYVYMPKEWLIPMNNALDMAIEALEQEPKTGHWILGICDNCGYDWGKDAPIASVPNFCPNCGARMVEPKEEELLTEHEYFKTGCELGRIQALEIVDDIKSDIYVLHKKGILLGLEYKLVDNIINEHIERIR